MPALPRYTYTKLDKEKQEIRLLTLLPNPNFNEPIRMSISHFPFIIEGGKLLTRPNMEAQRRTLPEGWKAYETLEGRVLFRFWDASNERWISTWKSPSPGLESSLAQFEPCHNVAIEPKFEALSYAWGSSLEPEKVYVMNTEETNEITASQIFEERQLEVTGNLASALKHLRYDDRIRTVWVDAICINQHDLVERNEQVSRMKGLYKYIDRVIVWLGPSSATSTLALSTIEHIGRQTEIIIPSTRVEAPAATEPNWYLARHTLPYDEDTWQSVHDLILRAWFDRVWTVQEIQLANSNALVQCGKRQVPWYYFRRGIICSRSKLQGVPKELTRRLVYVDTMCRPMIGWSLPQLLLMNTDRECLNPLDKVYGILGVAPSDIASRIVPDYKLSIIDGYMATFLQYTLLSGRLDLLDHSSSKKSNQDWPSWVPNWSIQQDEIDYFGNGFCSSGDSAALWSHPKPNILEVTGVHVATITQKLTSAGDLSSFLSAVERDNQSLYPTGESLLEVYTHVRYKSRFQETLHTVHHFPLFPTLLEAQSMMLEGSSKISRHALFTDDVAWISTRIIMRTGEGYLGMAPEHSQTGDIICIILGATLPTILRKKQVDSDSTFNVIGHCYLYGMMHGEALAGPVPKPWTIKRANDSRESWYPVFFNAATNEVVGIEDDPRLGSVPDVWERLENDNPFRVMKWKNRETGEVINSDPRLLSQALTDRGVKLQTFALS